MQDRDMTMEEWQEYGDELLEDTVPLGGGAKKRRSSASASSGRGRPSNLDKLQQIGMEASQRTKEDLKDLTTNIKEILRESKEEARMDRRAMVSAIMESQQQNITTLQEMQRQNIEALTNFLKLAMNKE